MMLDPDTDIQFRKGGKIMKKTPRKFQAGGETEAPKTGMELELDNMRKDRRNQRGFQNYEAGRSTMLGPKVPAPTPPKPFGKKAEEEKKLAKGGKIRKFNEGGDVTQDTRERRADEKDKSRKESAPIESRTTPYTSGDFDKRVSPETDWPSSTAKSEPNEGRGGGAGATEPDYVPTTGVREGRNSNISDDTRKRAEAAMNRQGEKKAPKVAKSAPKKDYGERGNMYGERSFKPPELTAEERAERSKKEREQGIERVYPEALLPIGRAASMARNALSRMFGKGAADDAASSAGTALAREAGPRITRLPDGPRVEIPRALPGNSRAALPPPAEGSRAALTGQPPMLPSPAARLPAPARPASPTRASARNRDEEVMAAEGGPNFGLKKGGKVAKYAKGGGIESKGKTQGKIVKMAKGGSVKGWGMARGSRAAKIV
jgi:hypothetical protein